MPEDIVILAAVRTLNITYSNEMLVFIFSKIFAKLILDLGYEVYSLEVFLLKLCKSIYSFRRTCFMSHVFNF